MQYIIIIANSVFQISKERVRIQMLTWFQDDVHGDLRNNDDANTRGRDVGFFSLITRVLD